MLRLPAEGRLGARAGASNSTLSNPEALSNWKKEIQKPVLPREAEPARAAEKRARLRLEARTPPPALPQDQQRTLQPSPHFQEHARLRRSRRHGGHPVRGSSDLGHQGRKGAARATRAGAGAAAAAVWAARVSRTRRSAARQPTAPPAGRRAYRREDSI